MQDWTPVRNGEIYCSPACSCGCTQAEFELAHIRADRLVSQLNSIKGGFKDWTARVWENMGWHYSATRNIAQVGDGRDNRSECALHEYLTKDGKPNRYWCSLVVSGRQFCGEGTEAEEALVQAIGKLNAFRATFIKSFTDFEAMSND